MQALKQISYNEWYFLSVGLGIPTINAQITAARNKQSLSRGFILRRKYFIFYIDTAQPHLMTIYCNNWKEIKLLYLLYCELWKRSKIDSPDFYFM